ncbi:MAG: apolipoprotein N-acyltransferase [Syntrophorhabdaceae bacterium]|nr:apolipoprotein N-acyltransferase [Syntrophorhabdaceae bacterium]
MGKEKGSLRPFFLPFLSGILIIISQPPLSISPAAYFALIPLFVSLRGEDKGRDFLKGFITGVFAYLGLIYWVVIAMNRYGGLDMVTSCAIMLLLVLYMALYIGLFALTTSWLYKKVSIPAFITAPFTWVILEYLRGIILTGFPWSLMAYSQHNFLPLIQVTSITGPYFISFLIVGINSILFESMKLFVRKGVNRRGPKERKAFFITTFIIAGFYLLSLFYGYERLKDGEKGSLKAVIVQGNIPQDVKWDEAFRLKTIMKHVEGTIRSGLSGDIVVWPETAIPLAFNEETKVKGLIEDLTAKIKTHLLFGSVMKIYNRYFNTAYLYGPDGTLKGTYSKVHLVPFGEYTPLIEYFPFLTKITAAGGDFHPGSNHNPISAPIGKIGVIICYEGIFPYITNETVRRGAQLLVNITNDAWFGKTSAPYQHLAFYIFRAIETDRYVLRAANTGISAVIDHRGRILSKTDLFVETTLSAPFSMKETLTFYVRGGDYFILCCTLFLGGVVLFMGFYAYKRRKPL